VLLAALSVVGVQQARRAWRDPDWEPATTRQAPATAGAAAGVMISLTVLLAGGSVLVDGSSATRGVGAALIVVGFAGFVCCGVAVATTRRYGRPRLLVPPPLRPGYPLVVPAGAAQDETVAGMEVAKAVRDAEAARAAAHALAAAGPASDSPPPAEPTVEGEFIVITGPGRHTSGEAGGTSGGTGRLVLTTDRLLLSTCRLNLAGQQRGWPVADLREAMAGPGEHGLTLRLADGRAETFTVDKQRDLWLAKIATLLSLPRPVTSWYGDPAEDGRPVAVPGGSAVLVLSRAEGERRDRTIGYRILLDRRPAGKIKHGQRMELTLAPGRHLLALRSTWVGSRAIPFQAEAGQVLRFCCEPGGFPGITQADMERDPTGYIRLRRLPDAGPR
jgi:hypothetical protein